jgi:hypothetical protein
VVLKTVVYQDGQFSFVAAMQFAQAADGYDLRATVFCLAFHHQDNFTIAVDKADESTAHERCAGSASAIGRMVTGSPVFVIQGLTY